MIDILRVIELVSNTLKSIPAGNILAIHRLGTLPRRHCLSDKCKLGGIPNDADHRLERVFRFVWVGV
jgi:hypothetical protein